MATDNNIKNYSAADIEKYHKGLLSAKERHDLEKAALDDPFLAEAMEGYAVAGVDHVADMNDLKNRLAGKMESGKVISMKGGSKTSFPWLRVAALIVIIGGAALLAQQLIFTGKPNEIAQAEHLKKEELKPVDTATTVTMNSTAGNTVTHSGTTTAPTVIAERSEILNSEDTSTIKDVSRETDGYGKINTNDVATTGIAENKPATAQTPSTVALIDEEKAKGIKAPGRVDDKKDIAKEEANPKGSGKKKETDGDGMLDQVSRSKEDKQGNRSAAPTRKMADEKNYLNQLNYTFRGRVTDSNNVGVPFARVYNPADNNAGTYTDVAGNFNLTYPDTVLNVQVRSIGFENNNVQLRNNVSSNQVIMQDERRSLSEVAINSQMTNSAARSRDNNVKLVEPEPVDGWVNYDTYIVNNLNLPEEIKTRQNTGGEVEVSFEVDKNGNPINIKVEKSLCGKCDDEAIRLIKEGPKWKRHAKKGRTTVTVPFNNSL